MERRHLESVATAQGKILPLREWSTEFRGQHPNPQLSTLEETLRTGRLVHEPRHPSWLNHLDRIKQAFAAMWEGDEEPALILERLDAGAGLGGTDDP